MENDLCTSCDGVFEHKGSDLSTGLEWIQLECGKCGKTAERRGVNRIDPSRDEGGDLIGAGAYYRSLVKNWILTSAAAELTIIPAVILAVFIGFKRADYVYDLAFFGLILWGADRVAHRYGLSAEDIGWTDRNWQFDALIGVLATLAMISLRDLFFWPFVQHYPGRHVFEGLNDLLIGLGKVDTSALTALYLKYMVGAFAEEVYCRGVLFAVIDRRDGPRWGMAWSSFIFSAWHQPLLSGLIFGWELTFPALVMRTISGIVYCWLRMKTRSLVAPFFAHCTHNMFVSVYELTRP